MARPLKSGLDFFSLDTNINDDPKIELIEAKHGIIGFGLYIKLLIKIYRAGYYIKFTEREQLIFSKRINVDINSIKVNINDLINEGLFDKNIYFKYQILTSKRIQKQYVMALKRRSFLVFQRELLLLDNDFLIQNLKNKQIINVNVNNNSVIVDINSVNSELMSTESTQIKLNKNKIYIVNRINVDSNSKDVKNTWSEPNYQSKKINKEQEEFYKAWDKQRQICELDETYSPGKHPKSCTKFNTHCNPVICKENGVL